MPKTRWTVKELKEIWARGIKCWPPPGEGIRYGASDHFLPLLVNNWSVRQKFSNKEAFEAMGMDYIHSAMPEHRFVGDLLFGGTGGGKTSHAVGIGMEYTFMFPGCKGLVGGRVYGDLKENVISQYQALLSIKAPWDHPAVKSHPSMTSSHNKKLIIEPYPGAMWSEIEFFQMDDWERVRGRNRDWMHLEEISQFQDDSVIDEAPRRLRGTILPVSHLICTTNPPESTSHWTYPKWNVNQYLASWDGPRTPIGNPCKCQFCQSCLNHKPCLGEFPYDEFGVCTNPECAFIKISNGQRGTRDYYSIKDSKGIDHRIVCPGNQNYWRLFFSDASDNNHIRADYLQTIIGSSDSRVAALYAKGTPMELNSNNAYRKFSQANINHESTPLDPEKEMHWSFDFNTRPQCSVICQETYDIKGELDRVDQIGEIILFDIKEVVEQDEKSLGAGPEHVAAAFMEKYPEFKQIIHLWGDPTAVNKSTSPLEATKFQIIHDILVKKGYKVVMEVKKQKGVIRLIPLADRVNNANYLFRDDEGKIKFFINKECEYTITSLRDVKIDKSGEKLDKRLIDEYARRTTKVIYPEDVYKRIQLVSHPGDAITYYLFQRFPLIKNNIKNTFFVVPGETSFKLDGNKMTETKSLIKEQEKEESSKLILEPEPTFMEVFERLGFNDNSEDDSSFFLSHFGQ